MVLRRASLIAAVVDQREVIAGGAAGGVMVDRDGHGLDCTLGPQCLDRLLVESEPFAEDGVGVLAEDRR